MDTVTDAVLDELIAAELPSLTAIRHDLHAHPQLGYEETYASALVQRELSAVGVPYAAGLAETGVVGWIMPEGQGQDQAAVGLRADMDALPISEQTGLPYASQYPGRMHACGHDGHTAVLLGAARVLGKLRAALPRPVKLIFQPAEEGGAGGKRMVEAGALKAEVGGVQVASLFGLHGHPRLTVGQAATRPGPMLAASDGLTITVSGRGGHAAAPHTAADPVVAAAAIITAAQTIVSRNVDPVDPAVISITTVHGGQTHNVIPEQVDLAGTLRWLRPATGQLLEERLRQVAEQVAAAHGCTAAVSIERGYPVLINDPTATAYAMRVGRAVLGEQAVIEAPTPQMGAEDFTFYGSEVPICFTFIGVRPPERESYPGLHHPQYDFTDAALPVGIKLMCRWALGGGVEREA